MSEVQKYSSTLDIYKKNLNNTFDFFNNFYTAGNLYFPNREGNDYHDIRDRTSLSYNQVATTSDFEKFREMVKNIEEIYPGEWQIELEYDRDNDRLFIIGFVTSHGDVEITNMYHYKHLLRECMSFFSIYTTGSNLRVGRPRMTRLKQTRREFDSSYFHSHIRAGKIDQNGDSGSATANVATYDANNVSHSNDWKKRYYSQFQDMCLGGSEQGVLRAQQEFNRSSTSDNFQSFLIHIFNTIRYESIEGGPYRRMEEIFSAGRNPRASNWRRFGNLNPTQIKQASEFLVRVAMKRDPNLKLNFNVQDHPFLSKRVTFHDNLKLKNTLIDTYRYLVSQVRSSTDQIVIENSDGSNRQVLHIDFLSKLFYSRADITSNEGVGTSNALMISPNRYFLPPTPNDGSVAPETVVRTQEGRMVFKGNILKGTVVDVPGERGAVDTYVDPQSQDIQLDPEYEKIIKSNVVNRLTKKVIQNA